MSETSFFQGHAGFEATTGFHDRKNLHSDKRRAFCGVQVSAVALGTYLGRMDYPTDLAVTKAVLKAVEGGINFFDSAINYRGQRGERSIGNALRQLILSGTVKRDEIFISTKGGFVAFEGEPNEDLGELFARQYVGSGIAKKNDLIAECHCMTPSFLRDQIERSRKNLQIEIIDLYYLHNPETQLEELPERIFHEKLFDAFRALEQARSEHKIVSFGLATWDGLREVPQAQTYLNLQAIVEIARQAAPREGDSGLRAIQLPLNLGMLEARFLQGQKILHAGDHEPETIDAVSAAKHLGLDVAVSAPLLQGQLSLAAEWPPFLKKHIENEASPSVFALNFVTSLAGVDAAMVGMKEPAHLAENIQALSVPNLSAHQIQDVLDSLRGRK